MKNFTSINDITSLPTLLEEAKTIKKNPNGFKSFGENKTLGLLFFNPSLRTRLSMQKAAQNLGMDVMVMNLQSDGWTIELEDGTVMNQGSQEHIREAAAVISQYCDIIGIRTFPAFKNSAADYREPILSKFMAHASVPIVSLESATLHPLQSFADVLTIDEFKTNKKPKVVLTWAPHPKALPQAVANSFAEWIGQTSMDLVITNPEGYDLAPAYTAGATIVHDQDEALKDADFVYAKNWSSYQQYGQIAEGKDDWMITAEKMQLTNRAKFMHCLPVRRNVVVSDEVIDSNDSLVIDQANNRTYAAQTVLLNLLKNEG